MLNYLNLLFIRYNRGWRRRLENKLFLETYLKEHRQKKE